MIIEIKQHMNTTEYANRNGPLIAQLYPQIHIEHHPRMVRSTERIKQVEKEGEKKESFFIKNWFHFHSVFQIFFYDMV